MIATTTWLHFTQWKYGLKSNKTTREPNNVHKGKQLHAGKRDIGMMFGAKICWKHPIQKIAIYLHEQQWKRLQTTRWHSEDARNSRENPIQSQFLEVVNIRLAIIGRSFIATIYNGFETFIMRWMETDTTNLAPRILVDLKMFTINNFALVDECPPCNNVEIVGTLLKFLNGAYMRNGNNPHRGPSSGY